MDKEMKLQALEHAATLDGMIDNEEDELAQMLTPIRDFLKAIADPDGLLSISLGETHG